MLVLGTIVAATACGDNIRSPVERPEFVDCPSVDCVEAAGRLLSSTDFDPARDEVFPGFVFELNFAGLDPLSLREDVSAACATCSRFLWWIVPLDEAWVAESATKYHLSSTVYVAPIDDATGKVTSVAATGVEIVAVWDSQTISSAQELGYDTNPMFVEFVNWVVAV